MNASMLQMYASMLQISNTLIDVKKALMYDVERDEESDIISRYPIQCSNKSFLSAIHPTMGMRGVVLITAATVPVELDIVT